MNSADASYPQRTQVKPRNVLLFIPLAILLIILCIIVYRSIPLPVVDSITLEAGSEYPAASVFCTRTVVDISYSAETVQMLRSGILNTPGTYPITLLCGSRERVSNIVVKDTTPPAVRVQTVTLINPVSVPDPMMFIAEIKDLSSVEVEYETEPDITISGSQAVSLILSDSSGNSSTVTSQLFILHDTEPPVISEITALEAYVGTATSYRANITVTDNKDPSPVLTIDNSRVNLSVPGIYDVIYTATDSAGNTASASTTIRVYEKKSDFVEPEVIYSDIDGLLSRIIRDDMTDREKVEAVYCWVIMHTQYCNDSDKSDWLQEAYRMYKNRRSDCFGYFALYKLMLQRLDIPYIEVTKVPNYPGDSSHYWLLVSIDRGENYYHMDAAWSMNLCLVTDEQLDIFSYQHNKCFNRDKSLYPPTPTEPLPASELPYQDPVLRETTY